MAKKKKHTKKSPPSASFGSSALADQLSRAKIDTKLKKAADHAPSPPPERPQPLKPEELLDGEELFLAALNTMPSPSAKQKQRGTSPFHGDFARQLQGHRPIDARREDDSPDAAPDQIEAPTHDEPKPLLHNAVPLEAAPLEAAPLEGDALFAHAIDTMQPADLFAGKYHGTVKNIPRPQKPEPFSPSSSQAPTKLSRAERLQEEERARAELSELREEVLFTRAVGGFDEVFTDHGKYHRQTPRTYKEEREERTGYSSESPEGLITPTLPKSGEGLHRVEQLDPSQRGLINRARLWGRKNELAVLNVRGDGVEDALRQVELFMHQQWKDHALYVRIVHGKGLQSEDGVPVLKPSILHWLEGPGFRYVRGYAPELTQDNDYGSVIVCLTQRDSHDKER